MCLNDGLAAAAELRDRDGRPYDVAVILDTDERLVPGGVLATYTCSYHMQEAELRGVLAEAATDAKRKLRVIEWCHQPADHPVLMTMPESEYLRGYIVGVE